MGVLQELIGWQQLREKYIAPGIPLEQALAEEPRLSLVYDPSPARLGLRLRLEEARKWQGLGPLQNVVVRNVLLSGAPHVEVLTDAPELFRTIYTLIGDMLSRVSDGEPDFLRALELSLGDFESLLSSAAQLTREKVIGLFGELWVLDLLLSAGSAPLTSWIGSDREAHDFRLGTLELEVKTTTANVRRHIIHGLNQLSASPGHQLSLLSIRLGSAGAHAGESLNDLVSRIRALQRSDSTSSARFDQTLTALGYDVEEPECSVRYQLTAPVMKIDVGADFPELSHAWLALKLGDGPAARVRKVELTLDLEGLGLPFNAAKLQGIQ